MPTLTLSVPAEFSFDAGLRYLARSPRESQHRVEDGRVKKVVDDGGRPVLLEVHAPEPNQLTIDYQTTSTNPELFVRNYVTEWFDLARDLRPFYALAKLDPLLGPAVEQNYGLRLIGIPNLFEALCWAIIGQQINLAFAYTLKQRFVQTLGVQSTYAGVPYYRFPTAEAVARIRPDQLTARQFSTRKAEYVIGVAQAIVEGRISKQQLSALPTAEAQETLIRQRGVGAWTAHYVLLKCLQRPDAFPAADVGLHNAIRQGLSLPHKPDLAAVHRYAEPWQGWRGYATFYLWQTLLP